MTPANLDRELAKAVADLSADQRRLMAKKLARWCRQLRALDRPKKPRRTLPRVGVRLLALN